MLRRLSAPVGFVVSCALAASAAPSDAPVSWLDRVNFYRATAALPPVTEDPALSRAIFEHARDIHPVGPLPEDEVHMPAPDDSRPELIVGESKNSTSRVPADGSASDVARRWNGPGSIEGNRPDH